MMEESNKQKAHKKERSKQQKAFKIQSLYSFSTYSDFINTQVTSARLLSVGQSSTHAYKMMANILASHQHFINYSLKLASVRCTAAKQCKVK